MGDQPETSQAGEIGLASFNVLSLLGAIELEQEELTPPPTVQHLQNQSLPPVSWPISSDLAPAFSYL